MLSRTGKRIAVGSMSAATIAAIFCLKPNVTYETRVMKDDSTFVMKSKQRPLLTHDSLFLIKAVKGKDTISTLVQNPRSFAPTRAAIISIDTFRYLSTEQKITFSVN